MAVSVTSVRTWLLPRSVILQLTPEVTTTRLFKLSRQIRNRMKATSAMAKRGALIVLEGCDKSGKTTQCRKLFDRLSKEQVDVQLMKFPERSTTIGQLINSYLGNQCELEDHAIHLLFSANRWELVPKMKNLLLNGTSVIVDRYAYSGVAFTAAKKGFELEWCRNPDRGLPQPDLVMYLTLSSEAAAKRGDFGSERYEFAEFQKKVAANFEKMAKSDNHWTMVDADKEEDELHGELYSLVTSAIKSAANQPLGSLWTQAASHD